MYERNFVGNKNVGLLNQSGGRQNERLPFLARKRHHLVRGGEPAGMALFLIARG